MITYLRTLIAALATLALLSGCGPAPTTLEPTKYSVTARPARVGVEQEAEVPATQPEPTEVPPPSSGGDGEEALAPTLTSQHPVSRAPESLPAGSAVPAEGQAQGTDHADSDGFPVRQPSGATAEVQVAQAPTPAGPDDGRDKQS